MRTARILGCKCILKKMHLMYLRRSAPGRGRNHFKGVSRFYQNKTVETLHLHSSLDPGWCPVNVASRLESELPARSGVADCCRATNIATQTDLTSNRRALLEYISKR